MATIQDIKGSIAALRDAGYPESHATLVELRQKLAEMEGSPATAMPKRRHEVDVDSEAFNRGGTQYAMPSEAGTWKSKLVSISPGFKDSKQEWWEFETNDERLSRQGRGVIVITPRSGGDFALKDVLDGLGVLYELKGTKVSFDEPDLPMDCWAYWGPDDKGKAPGNVKISGLRPGSANIEPAM